MMILPMIFRKLSSVIVIIFLVIIITLSILARKKETEEGAKLKSHIL
jgi:preprotein translocase subunit SecG